MEANNKAKGKVEVEVEVPWATETKKASQPQITSENQIAANTLHPNVFAAANYVTESDCGKYSSPKCLRSRTF